MNNCENERFFIKNGLVMSFDELGNFIKDSLEQLQKQSDSDFDFPKQEKTYDELISLLEKKIKDDLKTPKIDRYLQDFREKNFYYSKSNSKYEEIKKSVESFLENLEKVKGKFKVLKIDGITEIDNLAFIIKSQHLSSFHDEVLEIANIVTPKVISDEMVSCVSETLLLLEKNKELYFSKRWSENELSTPDLKSFGRLIGSTRYLSQEKSITYSFRSFNLEYILRQIIYNSIFHLKHNSLFRNTDFCRAWLLRLRYQVIEKSVDFVDEMILLVKNKAKYESEKYKRQIQTDSTILQKELELKISREEDLIYGKSFQERREFIISLRSK